MRKSSVMARRQQRNHARYRGRNDLNIVPMLDIMTILTFFLIFVPCFLVLIALALLGQLVGISWKGWLPGAENMNNVFSGTRAAVYTFLSYIN